MLTISRSQWRLMEERFTDMASSRVVRHLRENCHEACQQLTEAELQDLANGAVRDARAAGFSAHRDDCAYASLRLLAPGFEQRPQVQAILREAPIPEDTRMARILSTLQEDDVAGAAP